jgi:hypothetical protein
MLTMKKTLMACLLGLGLVMVGCNGDGDGATAVSEGDLVGKWYYKTGVSKGYFRALDDKGKETFRINIDTTETFPANTYYIEFKSDKTYTANTPDEDIGEAVAKRAALFGDLENGTWSVSGNTVTTISTDGDTSKVAAKINGNSASFTFSVDESETDPETGGKFESKLEATLNCTK